MMQVQPIISYVFLGLLVILFGLEVYVAQTESKEAFIAFFEQFSKVNEKVVVEGEYWRWVATTHGLSNMPYKSSHCQT